MRYIMRIGGMIIGVVLGSAALAAILNQFAGRFVAMVGFDPGAVFVGLLTMGFLGAILTREVWLAA
jgi:hypothetical protein